MMWELEHALKIVRAMQPTAKTFGYHIALGGSVLNKGRSDKDLDLYFMPMGHSEDGKPTHKADAMLKLLDTLWGAHQVIGAEYGDDDLYTHRVKYFRQGGEQRELAQRIDCFIY